MAAEGRAAMADASLQVMATIVRLRTAQCEAARADLLSAEQDLVRVTEAEERVKTTRDHAEAGWRDMLRERRPDPGLVRLAGSWLVERERDVATAHLDSEIAGRQRDASREALQQARARLDASAEVRSLRVRAVARHREQIEMADAADQFLQGRRSWR
ncbi:hypothetical protein HY78_24275 [Rhizorhabdus wittichii DC-6]|nr:hypothetical protein HY78_24275 [Rhizorhabdus wittichii DC-6]